MYIFQQFDPHGRTSRGVPFTFLNLSEDDLRQRVVDAWETGRGITWGGQTAQPEHITTIRVFQTETEAPTGAEALGWVTSLEREVTNDFITGPAGSRPAISPTAAADVSPLRDARRVMVVHGRNREARNAMFTFLRALSLQPIEWEQAVAETGLPSPHNLDAVRAAMDVGQAVVVLLTAEDRAGLLPALGDGDDDVLLRGQPRQNVTLEAGMAMGIDRARTVLVELGEIRRASDFDGLNAVRLTNDAQTRNALRSRLQTAGCAVDESAMD